MRLAPSATLIAVALVVLASGGSVLRAAPAPQAAVQISASGGYGSGGAYLIGEWFPVRVTLNNPAGGSARRVRVLVDALGESPGGNLATYEREVDLPAQSRKELTLYSYSSTFSRSLTVRVLEGNTQIGSVDVSLSPFEQQTNLLMGVLSSDQSLLNVLNGEGLGHTEYPPQESVYGSPAIQPSTTASASVLHIALSDIPTLSNALDSLDVILIDDVDTGLLTTAQRESLAMWVGRGGMLIGLGRPGGAGALTGVSDLLPVTLGNPVTLSGLAGLGDLVVTPITPTGQVLVPSATLRDLPDLSARSLASQDGTSLVAMRDLGEGQVAYVGLSPAVAPLKGWDGTVPLFKRIIAEHAVRLSMVALSSVENARSIFAYGELFDIPGLDLPSEAVVALFLFVYIMLIGPVNFIVLRRMKRGELAWVTVPVLVLLFSIGGYVVGYGAKGGELLTVRSNVAYTAPGLPQGSLAHYFGIFSPRRGTFSMEFAGDSAISEVDSSGYSGYISGSPDSSNRVLVRLGGDSGGTRVSNVNVDTWSLKALMSTSALPAQSPIETDLYVGNDVIEGNVRNRSGVQLDDVVIMRGMEIQRVGTLAPGEEKQLRLSVSSKPFTTSSPDRFIEPPPGVDPSGSPPYYEQRQVSDEQRRYNRRVQLLSIGLRSLLTTDAPADLSVIALGWGPPAPGGFTLAGSSPRSEELNLWLARLPVRGSPGAGSNQGVRNKLNMGNVPFSVYAPGNSQTWLESGALGNTSVTLTPYTDLLATLPAGAYLAGGDKVELRMPQYTSDAVYVLAYNVASGSWDRVDDVTPGEASLVMRSIPSLRDHVGPAGDLTIRLVPKDGSSYVDLSSVAFSLNSDEGR